MGVVVGEECDVRHGKGWELRLRCGLPRMKGHLNIGGADGQGQVCSRYSIVVRRRRRMYLLWIAGPRSLIADWVCDHSKHALPPMSKNCAISIMRRRSSREHLLSWYLAVDRSPASVISRVNRDDLDWENAYLKRRICGSGSCTS